MKAAFVVTLLLPVLLVAGCVGQTTVAGNSTQPGQSSLQVHTEASSFKFDGTTNSALSRPSDSTFNLGSQFSIAFWLKVPNANTFQVILSRYVDGVGGWYVAVDQTTGAIKFYHYTTIDISGTKNVADGLWHSIITQREGDGKIHIYIDGVEDGLGTMDSTTYTEAYPLFIGVRESAGHYPLQNGAMLSDVRLWTTNSLSPTQRYQLYSSGNGTAVSIGVPAESHWYRGSVTDSAHGYDLTLGNSVASDQRQTKTADTTNFGVVDGNSINSGFSCSGLRQTGYNGHVMDEALLYKCANVCQEQVNGGIRSYACSNDILYCSCQLVTKSDIATGENCANIIVAGSGLAGMSEEQILRAECMAWCGRSHLNYRSYNCNINLLTCSCQS